MTKLSTLEGQLAKLEGGKVWSYFQKVTGDTFQEPKNYYYPLAQ